MEIKKKKEKKEKRRGTLNEILENKGGEHNRGDKGREKKRA